jgi:hypothetical protein
MISVISYQLPVEKLSTKISPIKKCRFGTNIFESAFLITDNCLQFKTYHQTVQLHKHQLIGYKFRKIYCLKYY